MQEIQKNLLLKKKVKYILVKVDEGGELVMFSDKTKAGFLEQVYWVTKGGTTRLDIELALDLQVRQQCRMYLKI